MTFTNEVDGSIGGDAISIRTGVIVFVLVPLGGQGRRHGGGRRAGGRIGWRIRRCVGRRVGRRTGWGIRRCASRRVSIGRRVGVGRRGSGGRHFCIFWFGGIGCGSQVWRMGKCWGVGGDKGDEQDHPWEKHSPFLQAGSF